jgi:hypothetical protein
MSMHVTKEQIQQALKAFGSDNLCDTARDFFNILGYTSEKRTDLTPNDAATFVAAFDPQHCLNAKHALLNQWRSVDLLFQLTSEEISQAAQGRFAFSGGRVDNTIIESYLFFVSLPDTFFVFSSGHGTRQESGTPH